jgi:outer membrane beta-barrel protein
MRLALLLAALLVALPASTVAQQEMPGLDLSDEPKKPEGSKSAPALESTRAPAAKPPDASLSEAEIASEDRVKSVQRKAVLQRGRFELTPMAFVTLNDGFFPKFGPGGRFAFYLAEAFALALRYQQYNLIPDDNVRLAKRQLQSQLPHVLPEHSLGLDLLWSPIYGKVALFNSIHHFNLYILGGVGALWSQTSGGSAPTGGDGPHLTTALGIGERFGLLNWLAVDLSLIETFYSDRPLGSPNKSILQHALTLNLGVSLSLPFSFEYKEP